MAADQADFSESPKFDVERILAQAPIAEVIYRNQVTSTNDLARELAATVGRRLPALVLADQQTAGRGRGTNRWWTGAGSLACSLLFEPAARGIARQHFAIMSLAAAVSIVDAIVPEVAGHSVGLHWPNDVFVDGCKLAGILVEGLSDGTHVLGFGINVNNTLADAPVELKRIVTSLSDLTGKKHDRTRLLIEVLNRLEAALNLLAVSPEKLARRANDLCLQHGRPLTIQSGNRSVYGTCAGIADDGALRLATEAGIETIYSGVLLHEHRDFA